VKSDLGIRVVLARNVRRLRELKGWTHDVLAKRLGVGASRVAAIESARLPDVRIGIVEAMARELEVEVVELLTRKTAGRKAGLARRPPKARRLPKAKIRAVTSRAAKRRGF
jgi:transcriptional regulator with XRE-family HTH domain